jgi:hypothetical protein
MQECIHYLTIYDYVIIFKEFLKDINRENVFLIGVYCQIQHVKY